MNINNRLNCEKKVISFIHKEYVLTLTKKLIEIPSVNPPGKEEPVAKFIYKLLSKAGFETRIQEVLPKRPNVLASLRGRNDKQLIFNAHMDVVPAGEGWRTDPFKGLIINNKIVGRGAADMKGGLAAMLTALLAIKKANVKLNGDIIFHAVIDEEVKSSGTKNIINNGVKADYAVIGEPTNLSICIAQKGRLVIKITVNGKAAHASIPDEGINAISETIKILNKIVSYERKLYKKKCSLLGFPTQTITMINGGVKSNIVPEKCEVIIDRRLIPGENTNNIKNEFRNTINKLQRTAKGSFRVNFIEHEADPLQTSPNEQVVKVACSAVNDIIGKARIIGFPAVTDAYLYSKAKIPTIILGPGSLAQAHKPNEYVKISELIYAAKIYALIATRLLKDK